MKKLLTNLSLTPNKQELKALLTSFIIINFTYLYHTLNFMWGNHDVYYVKYNTELSSGLFEGRFTQFILPALLTNGQILPIINNLIAFIFLTLGLYILAKYFKLQSTFLTLTLFISFFCTQPYTISILYFAFISISCFAWLFFSILGLYLSSQIPTSSPKLPLSIASIICFYLPLGGYPPVINTFFVCLSAKITLDIIFERPSIKSLYHTYKYTIINIIIASILFKITLYFLPLKEVYNMELTPLLNLPQKFISTLKISFSQFFISQPFMPKSYKILLAIMSFTAIFGALNLKNTLKTRLLILFFIIITIWFSSLTTFLVTPPTEFVSRIDFYGFALLYAFFLLLLINLSPQIFNSLGIILSFILIFLNIINNYHAQYVWYEGFKHEMKILESINERIESHPNFNPLHQYRVYQAGDITMRPIYYNQKFDKNEPFLLTLPYLAMWQTKNLLEFNSSTQYISAKHTILPQDITKDVYDFIINQSRVWPEKNSIYIQDNIIIIILNSLGQDELKQKVKKLYKLINHN